MTTADGWRAVARTLRWGPLLVAPFLGCAALVTARAVFGPTASLFTLMGATTRVLTCVSVAFLVDDPAESTTPAAPVTVRRRLITRAALGVPVALLGWVGLVATERSLTDGDVALDGRAALALAAAAVGVAAMAGRHGVSPSPGAIGAAGVATIATAATLVPPQWVAHAPHESVVAALATVLGLVGVWFGSREPRP